mgnify:FL=1
MATWRGGHGRRVCVRLVHMWGIDNIRGGMPGMRAWVVFPAFTAMGHVVHGTMQPGAGL